MHTRNEPMTRNSRHGPARYLVAGYWLATAAVAGEMGLGGVWDIARLPFVTDLVTGLGYPTYFLVLSHLTTGYALGEVGLLAILTILTVLSWGLRPPSRRVWRQTPAAPPVTNAATGQPAPPATR